MGQAMPLVARQIYHWLDTVGQPGGRPWLAIMIMMIMIGVGVFSGSAGICQGLRVSGPVLLVIEIHCFVALCSSSTQFPTEPFARLRLRTLSPGGFGSGVKLLYRCTFPEFTTIPPPAPTSLPIESVGDTLTMLAPGSTKNAYLVTDGQDSTSGGIFGDPDRIWDPVSRLGTTLEAWGTIYSCWICSRIFTCSMDPIARWLSTTTIPHHAHL